MKRCVAFVITAVLFASQAPLKAQFDPEEWPDTADEDALVHYVSVDQTLFPLGDNWTESLSILTGGDHDTQDIDIGGFTGRKAISNYFNIADSAFEDWAEVEVIDILVSVYGDSAVLAADGSPRNFNFLTGTLPELAFPVGGQIPAECKNRQWNWFLFRIDNGIRPSDGSRFVGSIPANSQGGNAAGGVNGGTIRIENVPQIIIRAVAFGEMGAFGEPTEINICEDAVPCADEPETNLVWADINNDTSDHLELLNDGDQTVTIDTNVGPAGDKRRAARPDGVYMNFGITEDYLGQPCNEPRSMKICVEFYDEPALIGASFGPEAYATDDQGGIAAVPLDRQHILEGTDTWIRRSWVLSDVSLAGVNTGDLTGGPRLNFLGGEVYISYMAIAVFREGNHPLAGQDPLSDCYADPLICTDAYGNYAELDLGEDPPLEDGIAPGNSGGDQEMIIEEGGPANDRRMGVRAAHDDGVGDFRHDYINFALVGEPFGPSSQPNAHIAICVTYYDDPLLVGHTLRPEVYKTEVGGAEVFAFTNQNVAISIEGTDEWRDAYWEIPNMKFSGVNQGPQAAARFHTSAGGKILITRVRYAVIRPCGPQAGVNLLEECNPVCTDEVTNYAEMDLGAVPPVLDGLEPGTSAGDQEMIEDEAGPANDRRMAIRPAHDDGLDANFPHIYLNFAIVGEPFGPTSQPNAHLAICVTYYDDPELVGHTFRPEVYRTNADASLAFTDPAIAVTLEGTDTWRDAYFEIPDMRFNGVNQGPQAAARFATSPGGKIFFTRVQYGIIRTCGPDAGENPLEDCKPGGEVEVLFKRGDTNADTQVNITDAVGILDYLFSGEGREPPPCIKVLDTNDDGAANITDAVSLLGYLFGGSGEPAAPFADCGTDLTEDALTCESFPPCE